MLREWYEKTDKKRRTNTIIYPSPPLEKYDAIVIGAGPAGSTAAYYMSKNGLNVLLVERGTYPGSKTCGGTSIISEHTHKLFPNFWEELKWERVVNTQAYWWLTEDSLLSVEYKSLRLLSAPYNRFTVKRSNLYQWLSEKAVSVGTTLLLEHTVTKVLFNNQYACGIHVASPVKTFLSDLVILADGANSLLAEKEGLINTLSAKNLSLYVKETIALPASVIEERFGLSDTQGAIIGLIGYPTAGFNGTASIHTFKDSLNLNVGMSVSDYAKSRITPAELLCHTKKHPFIATLIDGGVSTEYGSAMIPEGGYYALPKMVHPGLLIIGDAAGLVNGTHGINLAMWSGYFAAQAAIQSKQKRDFSKKQLSLYQTLLEESFVIQDLKANRNAAKLQRKIPNLFSLYSKMANEAAYHSSKVYTMPKLAKRKYIYKKLTSIQPLGKILSDGYKVIKVILGG